MTEEAKAPAQALYDADAPQRVPLKIVQDGETYEVAHLFGNGLDDEALLCLIDTDESGRAEMIRGVWLQLLTGFEGYETLENETVAELSKHIPLDEAVSAIDEGLLMAAVIVRRMSVKKPSLSARSAVASYPLRAFFNGQFVDTTHRLAPYDALHYRVWQKIKSEAFPVKFGDHSLASYGRACVVLYDALQVGADGYAGRVPAHHKVLVIEQHFDGQSAAILAKK